MRLATACTAIDEVNPWTLRRIQQERFQMLDQITASRRAALGGKTRAHIERLGDATRLGRAVQQLCKRQAATAISGFVALIGGIEKLDRDPHTTFGTEQPGGFGAKFLRKP
jgi:hypothetical protein